MHQRFFKVLRIKSRNISGLAVDYVIELSVHGETALNNALTGLSLDKYSLIEHDNEDII